MIKRLSTLYPKILLGNSLIWAKLTNKRTPLMANLLITNRCNLKCFYCYVDTFNRNVKDIEKQVLFDMIDTFYDRGTRLIVLLGGEPLLYKEIGDVIRYIKNKNMVCEIITNGYRVEKYIEDLKLCDSVCVSLDGDEKSHDQNRGRGSYDVAIKAINLFRENGIHTRVKAVLTDNNKDSFDFLCKFAKEKGLILTISLAATYDERDYHQKNKWVGDKDKSEFLASLYAAKQEGYPIGYSFSALDYYKKWPYPDDYIVDSEKNNNPEGFDLLRCKRKDNSFYLDTDGYLYPCAYQWGKSKKNVFTDGFDSAWESMEGYDCFACGSLPDIDITLMFNCNTESIFKAAKFYTESK